MAAKKKKPAPRSRRSRSPAKRKLMSADDYVKIAAETNTAGSRRDHSVRLPSPPCAQHVFWDGEDYCAHCGVPAVAPFDDGDLDLSYDVLSRFMFEITRLAGRAVLSEAAINAVGTLRGGEAFAADTEARRFIGSVVDLLEYHS